MTFQRKLFAIVLLIGLAYNGWSQNLLSSVLTQEELKEALIPRESYRPVPGIEDREVWNKLPEELAATIVSSAESLLDYQWPSISATTTLLFIRTGDRDAYENLSFQKRKNLETLVKAELIENQGRFIDQVINGIWSICEESYWGVPAHLKHAVAGSGLPDVSEPWVDLFAAETVSSLAWTDYFLGDKLDAVSPQIRKRIKTEADQRIFNAILERPHGWQEWTFNWNPWISSNWLNAVLLLEHDQDLRTRHVGMVLEALDHFLDPYPSDGGCDEGPGYWNAAGSSLFESLELMNLATGGSFRVFDRPKIRNIGSYIYKVQVSENTFVNFADAKPDMHPAGYWIYRFGERIDDPLMMEFASNYLNWSELSGSGFHMTRRVLLMADSKLPAATENRLPLPGDVWFPEIEWMLSRDQAGSEKGLCLAAKGGHNAEAHNHNDVGSFMVYFDGKAVLIDVGSGTYTARFFGPERYSMWMINSAHHNVPLVNGLEQPAGPQFKASDVQFTSTGKLSTLHMDLKEAYPEEAGIVSLRRSLIHRKKKDIKVEELFELNRPGSFSEILMTTHLPDISTPGVIQLMLDKADGGDQVFEITYNQKLMEASFTKMLMNEPEDQSVIRHWGEDIYRIELKSLEKIEKGKIELKFSVH